MRYIGGRSGISRIKDIFYNRTFHPSCYQEDDPSGIQNRKSCQSYSLLTVIRIKIRLIYMIRWKQFFLSGKDRRCMSVITRSQQHYVKYRELILHRHFFHHQLRIAGSLLLRILLPLYSKHILVRNRYNTQQQRPHHAIITVRIFGRHTTFIYPKHFQSFPRSDIRIFIRP